MKAAVCDKYGASDKLQIREVEKPIPKDNEVLIKVHAVSINHADIELLKGSFVIRIAGFGLFRPKHTILGADISGTVEATGRSAKDFKQGDEVFGDIAGYGMGGLAEYVCVDPKYLVIKPKNLSHMQSAAVPMAAVTALQGLKKGNIQAGQKVLINGTSGGVGTFALQIAKAFGTQVTAVCSSRNIERARQLGADFTIDYTKEDFTKSNQKYDLILGVNGYHPLKDYKNSLSKQGTYIMVGGSGAQLLEGMLYTPFVPRKDGKTLGSMGVAKPNREDLEFIKSLLETGKIIPSIDKVYKLKDTAEAFRYMIEEHAGGKVIITVP